MSRIVRTRYCLAPYFLVLLLVACPLYPQSNDAGKRYRDWDFGVWTAGETGEELRNDFSEAQIFTAGVFAGKGWQKGGKCEKSRAPAWLADDKEKCSWSDLPSSNLGL